MLGPLSSSQIDLLLTSQLIGRIGFRFEKRIYIVPVAFAYSDGVIYAQSQEGFKIKAMRTSPEVCFEVESIDDMRNWRCAMVWGNFEELKKPADKQKAVAMLQEKLSPFVLSETLKDLHNGKSGNGVRKPKRTILYRIVVKEKDGRYEKRI